MYSTVFAANASSWADSPALASSSCAGTVSTVCGQPATGRQQTVETVTAQLLEAKAGLSAQLEAFAANTVEYMKQERALLLDGVGVPEIRTALTGRHALLVARGYDYRADLAALRHYIKEFSRCWSASTAAPTRCSRPATGRTSSSVTCRRCPTPRCAPRPRSSCTPTRTAGRPAWSGRRTSGWTRSASPPPAPARTSRCCWPTRTAPSWWSPSARTPRCWSSSTAGRAGMASTFLTRLRLGGTLVDAKAASRLYRSRISGFALLLVVVAALAVAGAVLALSTDGRTWVAMVAGWWDDGYAWGRDLFS